jgi:hypothetical protein
MAGSLGDRGDLSKQLIWNAAYLLGGFEFTGKFV